MQRFGKSPVFISHASGDSDFAERLDADLRAAGFTTWLDKRDLNVGDRLPASLAKAIGQARAMIAVISPSTAHARWMMREIDQATHRMVEEPDFKIIPALISEAEVPEGVRDLVYADFSADYKSGLDEVVKALRALLKDDWSLKFRARSNAVDAAIREVFGTVASAWIVGGYGIPDMDFVRVSRPAMSPLPEFDPPDDPADVALEVDAHSIDEFWLEGFTSAYDQYGARAGLVILEDPPTLDSLEPVADGVLAGSGPSLGYAYVCAVVLEDGFEPEVAHMRLSAARSAIQQHIWPVR